MRLTSYSPALDMLTIQLDPLSKPVGPVVIPHLMRNLLFRGMYYFQRSLSSPTKILMRMGAFRVVNPLGLLHGRLSVSICFAGFSLLSLTRVSSMIQKIYQNLRFAYGKPSANEVLLRFKSFVVQEQRYIKYAIFAVLKINKKHTECQFPSH